MRIADVAVNFIYKPEFLAIKLCVYSYLKGKLLALQVANVTNYKREPAEADWSKTVLRGRIGEVEEVAAVVTFLASKDANYVNGIDIPVDDGFLAMGVVGKGEFLNFTEPDF